MKPAALYAPLRLRYGFHSKRADLDQVGMTASLVCAIHCALMPLVVTLLPLIGLGFLANEATEWTLMGFSLLLGVASLCVGFRQHRRPYVLYLLAAGFALLIGGRIAEASKYEQWGIALVVLGGLNVAVAHFVSRRLCLACRVCHPQTGGGGNTYDKTTGD